MTVEDDNNKQNPHLLRVFERVLRCVGKTILTFSKTNVKKNKHGKEDANAENKRRSPSPHDPTLEGVRTQREQACPGHRVKSNDSTEEDS